MGKLDKILLSRALLTKTVLGAAAAAALTTGTVLGVSAYRSGNDFHPSGTERDFNANQVHFDDDQDVKGSDSSAEKDNSEFWEKDDSADDTSDPNSGDNADFMFQRERMQENFSDPISVVSSTAGTNVMNGGVAAGGSGDAVYNVTNDRSNADIIIGGRPGGNTVVVPGNGGSGTGAGTGENPGGNGSAENPSEPSTPNTPVEPSNPSTPSQPGNNNPSKPNGGNSGNNNGGSAADPTPGQGSSIADTVQDPDTGKTSAGIIDEHDPASKPYYEGKLNDNTVGEVVIQQPLNAGGYVDPSALYGGQKHITARKIYNALETYVKDSSGNTYYWNNLKDANGNDVHFGVFIRINGVWIGDTFFSFLNEETGEYDKVLDEIPSDTTEIKISASYRFSANSEWKDYPDISYALERNRIFILKRKLTEGDKNSQFDSEILLNLNTDTNFDPDDESKVIDLFGYQEKLLGKERLSALFPGWMEDGKLISWMYHPAAGRHVIEPADTVPLADNYVVQVKIRWYDTETGAVSYSLGAAADGLAVASADDAETELPAIAAVFYYAEGHLPADAHRIRGRPGQRARGAEIRAGGRYGYGKSTA